MNEFSSASVRPGAMDKSKNVGIKREQDSRRRGVRLFLWKVNLHLPSRLQIPLSRLRLWAERNAGSPTAQADHRQVPQTRAAGGAVQETSGGAKDKRLVTARAFSTAGVAVFGVCLL